MRVLRRGDAGPDVAEIRSILAGMDLLPPVTGTDAYDTFDVATESAVRAFQQRRGLMTDGVVGQATFQALKGASYHLGSRPLSYAIAAPIQGDDVFTLQERLTELGFDAGRPDGYFGASTERALRTFQRDMRLTPDGVCGPGDHPRAAPPVLAAGQGRPPRVPARAGAGAPGRSAAARQAHRDRPRPRR